MQLSLFGLTRSERLVATHQPSIPWTVGQVIRATVLEQLSGGNVIVSVDGNRLVASTPAKVVAGQHLVLRVSSLVPRPMLQLVSMAPASLAGQIGTGRGAVGSQSSALQQLLSTLRFVTDARGPVIEVVPPTVRELAADVLSAVRTAETLTVPRSLQQALWDAGLLLEARLASVARGLPAAAEITFDIKGRLLRLRSAVGRQVQAGAQGTLASVLPGGRAQDSKRASSSATPCRVCEPLLQRLLATVDTAVQRIEARQLRSLAGSAEASFAWHVEIPFLFEDRLRTVELVIERNDRKGDAESAPAWSARLALDTDKLGTVHARVILIGEAIGIQFWAVQSTTFALLMARRERLTNALNHLGLSVINIRCELGMPLDCPGGDLGSVQIHA